MKIVFDTDVMVAAFRSPQGASRAWLRAALEGTVTLLLSVPLMLQYEAVLKRPEHREACRMSLQEVDVILDRLCLTGQQVRTSFLWRPSLRDPNDEMVLETAVNGAAKFLVSFNERDFKGAERFGIQVMRPGTAWLHRQSHGGENGTT